MVLLLPDGFCTAKRVYNSFTSKSRPNKDTVTKEFRELEQAGIGISKRAGRSCVFYKKVPTDLQPIEHELGKYSVPIAVYKRCFMKDDFKISVSLREDIIEGHPFREAYKEYKDANELPLVPGQ